MAETGKFLFRKVEKAIEAIDRMADASSTIMQTATTVIEQFSEVLGVRGGRLYVRRDGGYELVRTFGERPGRSARPLHPGGLRSDRARRRRGRASSWTFRRPASTRSSSGGSAPSASPRSPSGDDEYILSFTVDPAAPEDDLLSLARHPAAGGRPEAAAGPLRLGPPGGPPDPDVDFAEARAPARVDRGRGLHDAGGARRRRLLRLHQRLRTPPRGGDRRRLGARACPQLSRCATSTRASAWRSSATSRSCARSSG